MKKEKKNQKALRPLAAVMVCVMLLIFAYQTLHPTQFGAVFAELSENCEKVTVTKTIGKQASTESYHTESLDQITEFEKWANKIDVNIRSIADGISFGDAQRTEYTFTFETADGEYRTMKVTDNGQIRVGSKLYKIKEEPQKKVEEMEVLLLTWETNEQNGDSK